MARYKLLSQHYIDGRLLEAGEEIGEGTEVPFSNVPSTQMEGVDEAGKKAVAALKKVEKIDTVLAKASLPGAPK